MQIINPASGPKAIGPYSPAIMHNGFVFTSGQIGKDPVSDQLLEGIEAQTRQVLANLQMILQEAGSDKSQVIKTTVFLTDMAHYALFNQVYAEFFGEYKPARSTVQVVKLPANALIEIEVVAALA